MATGGLLQKGLAGNSRRLVKPVDGRPAVELLPWSLYHRQSFAAAAAQTLTYFRSITAASLLDSNLTTDGLLPYPQSFDILAIAVGVQQGIAEADIENLLNFTVVQLSLSSKPYLQIPLFRIPAGGGLYGVATTNNVFQMQNGIPHVQNTWSLAIGGMSLFLPSQQDFAVELRYFGTAAFTGIFAATVYLDGVLARPVL